MIQIEAKFGRKYMDKEREEKKRSEENIGTNKPGNGTAVEKWLSSKDSE